LRRDPGDSRSNNALGLLLLRQGQFERAENHFRMAIERMTRHNPNPVDGEAYFNLGQSLRYQGRLDEAYDAFYKATWNGAMQGCGFLALGQTAGLKGNFAAAAEFASLALARQYHNQQARLLKITALRRLGQKGEARAEIELAVSQDPLDFGALYEQVLLGGDKQQTQRVFDLMRDEAHNYLELAWDYGQAGFFNEASDLLAEYIRRFEGERFVNPMVYYDAGYYYLQAGNAAAARKWFGRGAIARPDGCFPHRLESILVLRAVLNENPADARAAYYLGNLWYGKRQYDLATQSWERSCQLDEAFATVHRNLGLAYYNRRQDRTGALNHYQRAFDLDQTDARVLLELDQLKKKLGIDIVTRLDYLRCYQPLVMKRDDLCVEYITLLNLTGFYQEALELMRQRQFHPWEGGEGKVTGAWATALTELAKQELVKGHGATAVDYLDQALTWPENLGEGKLAGHHEQDIYYYMALACRMSGRSNETNKWLVSAPA